MPRLHSIYTKYDLAKEIGVPAQLVTRRAFMTDQSSLYAVHMIPKRSGGTRTISAPYWPMLNIQHKLLSLLEELYRPSTRVMGFVKGRGIKENAECHVGKRLILNIDIENYFPSVHAGRIRRRLMARPYSLSDDVATTIAKLCTLNGELPIGAPTSPILANIISSSLDQQLSTIAKRHGCFYTRYADDITFSTNKRSFPIAIASKDPSAPGKVIIGVDLNEAFSTGGFKLNAQKSRILDRTMRQEVCGVTCNVKVNANRRILREVRSILYKWHTYGRQITETAWKKAYNWRDAKSLESSLRGKIQHIIHLKGKNDLPLATIVSRYNQLEDREFSPIDYEYSGDPRANMVSGICLIESGDDHLQQWKQGSGFVINNGAILTNFHNISYDGVILSDIEAVFPEVGGIRYRMRPTYSDPDRDIAILALEDSSWKEYFKRVACKISFAEPETGSVVYAGGFPSYNNGDSCTISVGEVVGTSAAYGQRFFRISQMIVKGNSGGPIFDGFGYVIGIATRGVDTHDVTNIAFNGCIPMHTLDRLILDIE